MTIPASEIVQVNPGVVGAGGSPLALNGLLLTDNPLVPVGAVLQFPSTAAVEDYFGYEAEELRLADIYFRGYDNSTIKPGNLLIGSIATTPRAAWLRSGSLAALTLSELQAVNGTLNLDINGTAATVTVNLAAATSWSAAAEIMAQALRDIMVDATVTWSAVTKTFTITSLDNTIASAVGFADATSDVGVTLKFTEQAGAVKSLATGAQTPSEAMEAIWRTEQNWATFTTTFEPNDATKREYAEWANSKNQRILYVAWDTNEQATAMQPTNTFGQMGQEAEWDAVITVYNKVDIAVFVLGAVASIDFARTNGRITAAFKSQSGLPITCRDQQEAANLIRNGYSFYGVYATSNDKFNFLYPAAVTGKWEWLDTYVNQIHLNSQLQLALLTLLTNVTSIPYTEAGYSMIRAAMNDPIHSALNFGGIRPGVKLSAQQKATINQAAGKDVSNEIEQQGYYLQILDPGAQVRGLRGTPVINFWYTDGGAVQKITLASINIM